MANHAAVFGFEVSNTATSLAGAYREVDFQLMGWGGVVPSAGQWCPCDAPGRGLAVGCPSESPWQRPCAQRAAVPGRLAWPDVDIPHSAEVDHRLRPENKWCSANDIAGLMDLLASVINGDTVVPGQRQSPRGRHAGETRCQLFFIRTHCARQTPIRLITDFAPYALGALPIETYSHAEIPTWHHGL